MAAYLSGDLGESGLERRAASNVLIECELLLEDVLLRGPVPAAKLSLDT